MISDTVEREIRAILQDCPDERLQKKVALIFGDEGRAWLREIPDQLRRAAARWQLSRLQRIDADTVSVVLFAESALHGPAVLKIGVRHKELIHGAEALRDLDSDRVCRIYDWREDDNALLMERLSERTLWQEREAEYRWQVAAPFLRDTPRPLRRSYPYPVFGEQLAYSIDLTRRMNICGPAFLDILGLAEQKWQQFQAQNRPLLLIHGDLHHQNILRCIDNENEWKLIDPHGRLAQGILEIGPFLGNEWELYREDERLPAMDCCLAYLAGTLDESFADMRLAAGLHVVLSTCWHLEDVSGLDQIDSAIAMLRWLRWI